MLEQSSAKDGNLQIMNLHTGNLRDQVTKQARSSSTRRRITESAHALFVTHGFEAVTVDDIVAAAGLSRRTFFRHFPTKESVVFPDGAASLWLFRQLIAKETDGSPATINDLRSVLVELARGFSNRADTLAERRKFIETSPSLIASERLNFMGWERVIAFAIEGRLDECDDSGAMAPTYEAHMAAGAIMGVVVPTFWAWHAAGKDRDLTTMGMEALDRIEHGFGAIFQSPISEEIERNSD